jgi:hypothetical protein
MASVQDRENREGAWNQSKLRPVRQKLTDYYDDEEVPILTRRDFPDGI